MFTPWTRREFLFIGFGALATACTRSRIASPAGVPAGTRRSLDEIEATVGGRVGVFALDTGTGRELAHRPDERFAMCSTFKWVLAAAILARVDHAQLSLDERVSFDSTDLLEYAPVTREHVVQGSMTVESLAQAAITVSDNTAANLLLARVGGPAGFTQFVRSLGDPVTRLDRDEPGLNSNDPGDPRDTTSPRAMVGLMRRVLCGDTLSHPRASAAYWVGCARAKRARTACAPASPRAGSSETRPAAASAARSTTSSSPCRQAALPSSLPCI